MNTHPRWSRLSANSNLGEAGLELLHGARVVQVGAGVLGGNSLRHLALMGVETTIVDRGLVASENLGTQGLPEQMVSMPKAQVWAITLSELNSAWKVHAFHSDFRRVGMGVFAEADIALCALDSASGRAAFSEMMARVKRPWVDAAVDASGRPFGRVACYDPRQSGSPCYICPHDARSLSAHVHGGSVERCPAARDRESAAPPTLASPMLAGWVAALQVTWAVEMLLGRGEQLAGSEVYMDMDGLALRRHRLVRNPRCLFEHRALPTPLALGFGTGDLTVAETLALAGRELGGDAQLRLWRDSVVSELRCPACDVSRHPFRLLGALGAHETFCACGEEMLAPAGALFDRFGAAEAESFAVRSWRDLGLPDSEIIGARCGDKEICLRFD